MFPHKVNLKSLFVNQQVFLLGGELHFKLLPLNTGFVTYITDTSEDIPLVSFGDNLASSKIGKLEHLLLHHYNNDSELVKETEVKWKGRRDHLGLYSLGDKLIWVYNEQEKGDDALTWVQLLNLDGKLGKRFQIFKFNPKKGFTYINSTVSNDKSKRGFVFSKMSFNLRAGKGDDGNSELSFMVFNDDGSVVCSTNKKLTTSRRNFELKSIGVTNSGKIIAVADIYDIDNRKKLKGGSLNQIYTYTLAPESKEVIKTHVQSKGVYLSDLSLYTNTTGNINLFGIYRKSERKQNIGVFCVTGLSENSKSINLIPFNESDLQKLGTRVTHVSKGTLTLKNEFSIQGALSHNNGSNTILLEAYYRKVSERTGAITHNFNDGIIINYNNEGNINSATTIPKVQPNINQIEPYARMHLIEHNGKAAVVYNDNIDNLSSDQDQVRKALTNMNKKNAVATIAYTNEDEKLVRKPLFPSMEIKGMMIIPNSVAELSDGDAIFMTYGGKPTIRNFFALGKLKTN